MPVTISKAAAAPATTSSIPPTTPTKPTKPTKPKAKRPSNGHQKPVPVSPAMLANDLTRLRIGHVMWLLSLGYSAVTERIKHGQFPEPDGYDGRPRVWTVGRPARGRPFWSAAVVRDFLQQTG